MQLINLRKWGRQLKLNRATLDENPEEEGDTFTPTNEPLSSDTLPDTVILCEKDWIDIKVNKVKR